MFFAAERKPAALELSNTQGYLPFDNNDIHVCMDQIKRGEFVMPDFHADIKDLIHRMLTVDPSKRITVAEIKAHPAFAVGLPPGYILPAPIPRGNLTEPIERADPRVLETMKNIGFKADEIDRDLAGTQSTKAKEFYRIISHTTSLEQIPWEAAQRCKITVVDVEPAVKTVPKMDPGREEDRFRRQPKSPLSDQNTETYSFATKPSWVVNKEDVLYIQEKRFKNLEMTCDEMMFKVQRVLSNMKCDWFYPDNTRIIAKHERGAFITLDAAYRDEKLMYLYVKMNHGTVEVFEEFTRKFALEVQIYDINDQSDDSDE